MNARISKTLSPGVEGTSESVLLAIDFREARFSEQLVIPYYLPAASRLITNHD